MTDSDFKAQILRHCLWAGRDAAYAQWAAERYERESGGQLEGLADKVKAAIAKHAKGAADAPTDRRPLPR